MTCSSTWSTSGSNEFSLLSTHHWWTKSKLTLTASKSQKQTSTSKSSRPRTAKPTIKMKATSLRTIHPQIWSNPSPTLKYGPKWAKFWSNKDGSTLQKLCSKNLKPQQRSSITPSSCAKSSLPSRRSTFWKETSTPVLQRQWRRTRSASQSSCGLN